MWRAQNELVRSFASKRRLAAERDIEALWTKFEEPFWKRLLKLIRKPAEEPINEEIGRYCFGPFRVESITVPPITGKFEQSIIHPHCEITLLHLQDEFLGAQGVRLGLGRLALAMQSGPEEFADSFVMGVTYSELARLVLRLGFREIQIIDCDPDYERCVQASHKVFQTLNGKRRPFTLQAVGLPQQEFIERFAPYALEEFSLQYRQASAG